LLLYRDAFELANPEGLAICGQYVAGDAVHVGLYWCFEHEKKIIHFQGKDDIPIQEFTDQSFERYFFLEIPDFPVEYLPSLSAISELISENQINGFIFNRNGTVYDGGKFELSNGEYTGKTTVEKFINCAVFVVVLLKTFDYELLNWESWPDVQPGQLTFLDDWLNHNGVSDEDKAKYYQLAKEVRGKHVFICPLTATKPSPFDEVLPLSNDLIAELNN
jgi:hypothetical protein